MTSEAYGDSRAVVFAGAGRRLQIRSFPLPTLLAGEALVRVRMCTLCGSDLHTFAGARIEPTPTILGHEVVGDLVGIGPEPLHDIDGTPLHVGDRITWSVCASCFDCPRCRAGLPQKCERLFKYGHSVAEGRGALSGGLSEFIVLRRGSSIAKLDTLVPDTVACPINCATSTIACAFRAAGSVSGQRVLVFGAGMLGLTAAAYAKYRGASRVTVCDVDSRRLRYGNRFGADCLVDFSASDATEIGEDAYDLALECSGAPIAIETAVRAIDVGGRLILVGSVMNTRPIEIAASLLVRKCATVKGIHNYAPIDLRHAVGFVNHSIGRYPFADLIENTYSLDEVNQAFDFAQRERPIRVAVSTEGKDL